MNYLEQSLGELATEIPGATEVFHRYGLDFCCNGQRSLADALARKSIDGSPVVEKLTALVQNTAQQSNAQKWRDAEPKALIDHILVRYHERHREQLTELIRLARRVELVHGDREACPVGLADHLEDVFHELESHMAKEEQILFPMIAQGAYPSGPITVMEEEHVHHGEALDEIDRLTNGIELPIGACNTWTALYVGLREFKRDIMDHIHLENYVLFQQPQN